MKLREHTQCDQLAVSVLLNGDESQVDFQVAAAHVETCTSCQLRLTEMAGDQDQWQQVGDLLRTYPDVDPGITDQLHISSAERNQVGSREARGDVSSLEQHLKEFLRPPAQSEMLGRLGRYEIEGVIGSGGMGIVLRGFDTELHRPVAIKILAQHLAHSGAARQRFAREARAAAAVVHEHVVAIHDVNIDDKTPYLVMQLVAGESLQDRIDREGPLSAKEILRIGIQSTAALQAAHAQGVIHRDIKPANILLERGVERALVADFGLARTVHDASLTQSGIVTGTPNYMSPEQALGHTTDARSDLFSLGSVLYYMATGHPPFRAEQAMGVLNRICHEPHRPVWESNPELPDALSDIIDQMLTKKSSRRFASAAEVHQRLGRILADLQQHRPRPFWRRRRWLKQHRRGLIRATVALGAVAAVAAFFSWPVDGGGTAAESANDGRLTTADASDLSGSPKIAPGEGEATRVEMHQRAALLMTSQLAQDEEALWWQGATTQLSHDLERLGETTTAFPSTQAWDRAMTELSRELDNYEEEFRASTSPSF